MTSATQLARMIVRSYSQGPFAIPSTKEELWPNNLKNDLRIWTKTKVD